MAKVPPFHSKFPGTDKHHNNEGLGLDQDEFRIHIECMREQQTFAGFGRRIIFDLGGAA